MINPEADMNNEKEYLLVTDFTLILINAAPFSILITVAF